MTDLRFVIGTFFVLVGILVSVTGLTSSQRAPLEMGNVNLIAGLAMLVFGLIMLILSRRRA